MGPGLSLKIWSNFQAKSQTVLVAKKFVNHRAKRGGSLFQGGSGKEEGSRSDPKIAVGYPSVRWFSWHVLP